VLAGVAGAGDAAVFTGITDAVIGLAAGSLMGATGGAIGFGVGYFTGDATGLRRENPPRF
jgi:hypothetical protein